MPEFGLVVHEGLRVDVVPRPAALDKIAREGKRRAGKTYERNPVIEFLFHEFNGLKKIRNVLVGVYDAD